MSYLRLDLQVLISNRVMWDGHNIATIALPPGKSVKAGYMLNTHFDLQYALLRTSACRITTHKASW
jgi:hypothetical protein